jgi:hypothetical protein
MQVYEEKSKKMKGDVKEARSKAAAEAKAAAA